MQQPPELTKKRPIFLTVLCILTFVASGFGVLGGLIGLASIGMASEGMEIAAELYYEMGEEMGGGIGDMLISVADYMVALAPNAATMQLITLLLTAISLFGAIMMWKQKKVGFHMYTAANIFILIVPLVLVGFNAIAVMGVMFNAVINITFIVLYGLNLKHMN